MLWKPQAQPLPALTMPRDAGEGQALGFIHLLFSADVFGFHQSLFCGSTFSEKNNNNMSTVSWTPEARVCLLGHKKSSSRE